MKKLGTMNKATAAAIVSAAVMLINKYVALGLDSGEQGLVTAGLVGLAVYFIPNVGERK